MLLTYFVSANVCMNAELFSISAFGIYSKDTFRTQVLKRAQTKNVQLHLQNESLAGKSQKQQKNPLLKPEQLYHLVF